MQLCFLQILSDRLTKYPVMMKHNKVEFPTYNSLLIGCPCKEEYGNISNAFSVTTISSSVGGGFNIDLGPEEEKFRTIYSRRLAIGEIPSQVLPFKITNKLTPTNRLPS